MERNTAGFFRPPMQYLWAVRELFVLQMNAARELHSSESRNLDLSGAVDIARNNSSSVWKKSPLIVRSNATSYNPGEHRSSMNFVVANVGGSLCVYGNNTFKALIRDCLSYGGVSISSVGAVLLNCGCGTRCKMVVLDIDIGAGEQWRTQEARRQVVGDVGAIVERSVLYVAFPEVGPEDLPFWTDCIKWMRVDVGCLDTVLLYEGYALVITDRTTHWRIFTAIDCEYEGLVHHRGLLKISFLEIVEIKDIGDATSFSIKMFILSKTTTCFTLAFSEVEMCWPPTRL
ncbi:hypothetical protein CPB85DRAFT_1260999 [Mucidula mucida]|nr:hypothetical protein CPB85DRAFT_1260999 [Mucidula mucida]